MELSEITPVAQDYLKAIWSATEWGDPPITTTGLAERFGTTLPSVSETLRRLGAKGLIVYRPYKPVTLTALGEQYAIAMVRRHRLLETFLVTALGYPWEEVHDEAERLEHAASAIMIERIDAQLGHPTTDPHGDPIPTAQGHTHRPLHTTRLTEADLGRYEIVRLSDADPQRLSRFRRAGLVPGEPFRVITQHDSGTTGVLGNHPAAIDLVPAEAQAIWVTPAPPSPRTETPQSASPTRP